MESPLVSIACITFNQAKYIKQCLDGFVLQKTTFPVEIVIHDDASTDGTQDIIKEYVEKYSQFQWKPILQKENQYSKGNGILVPFVYPECTGKYVALCEGDDYWTDPLKLQKQVDFMESHPDFSMCFHNVVVFDQMDQQFKPDTITKDVPSVTDVYHLCNNGNYIHTPSVLYRRNSKVDSARERMGQLVVGDIVSHILHAQYGKIYKFSECMAVYRTGVGIWSSNTVRQEFRKFETMRSFSKLVVAVEDPELKKILDAKVTEVRNGFLYLHKDYEIAVNSPSYRLGHAILFPIIWLRKYLMSRKA